MSPLKHRSCRGGALIEFSLVVSVLLMLLAGVMDLSTLFYRWSLLQAVTTEALQKVARDRSLEAKEEELAAEMEQAVRDSLSQRPALGGDAATLACSAEVVDCQAHRPTPLLRLEASWRTRCLLCWMTGLSVTLRSSGVAVFESPADVECR